MLRIKLNFGLKLFHHKFNFVCRYLEAERAKITSEIPRLTESVCAAGAKIMELSDRIAASERARVELSRKLGEMEGALCEVRAERTRLEAGAVVVFARLEKLRRVGYASENTAFVAASGGVSDETEERRRVHKCGVHYNRRPRLEGV